MLWPGAYYVLAGKQLFSRVFSWRPSIVNSDDGNIQFLTEIDNYHCPLLAKVEVVRKGSKYVLRADGLWKLYLYLKFEYYTSSTSPFVNYVYLLAVTSGMLVQFSSLFIFNCEESDGKILVCIYYSYGIQWLIAVRIWSMKEMSS